MNETTNTKDTNAATDAPSSPSLGLQHIYLKDASYESPNSPHIFSPDTQIQFNYNITVNHEKLQDNLFEILLSVTITANSDDKSVYLVEVQQAGIFELTGFDEETLSAVKSIVCPAQLLPYAREAIASLTGKGGFPPFLLEPINFEEHYAQQGQEQETE